MITGRTRAFLLLPCDWRFLPKLGPAAAGVQGPFFGSRIECSRHQLCKYCPKFFFEMLLMVMLRRTIVAQNMP